MRPRKLNQVILNEKKTNTLEVAFYEEKNGSPEAGGGMGEVGGWMDWWASVCIMYEKTMRWHVDGISWEDAERDDVMGRIVV